MPTVGNTVNVKDASYTNAIGAPYLHGHWKDPAFDAKQRAFCYVRVIEIPTPRWTTYDATFFGTTPPRPRGGDPGSRVHFAGCWPPGTSRCDVNRSYGQGSGHT